MFREERIIVKLSRSYFGLTTNTHKLPGITLTPSYVTKELERIKELNEMEILFEQTIDVLNQLKEMSAERREHSIEKIRVSFAHTLLSQFKLFSSLNDIELEVYGGESNEEGCLDLSYQEMIDLVGSEIENKDGILEEEKEYLLELFKIAFNRIEAAKEESGLRSSAKDIQEIQNYLYGAMNMDAGKNEFENEVICSVIPKKYDTDIVSYYDMIVYWDTLLILDRHKNRSNSIFTASKLLGIKARLENIIELYNDKITFIQSNFKGDFADEHVERMLMDIANQLADIQVQLLYAIGCWRYETVQFFEYFNKRSKQVEKQWMQKEEWKEVTDEREKLRFKALVFEKVASDIVEMMLKQAMLPAVLKEALIRIFVEKDKTEYFLNLAAYVYDTILVVLGLLGYKGDHFDFTEVTDLHLILTE